MADAKYPEHEKLQLLLKEREGAQLLYDYITDDLGLTICEYDNYGYSGFGPAGKRPATLIAGALGIDEDKLEAEKVAMLEHQRRLNERTAKAIDELSKGPPEGRYSPEET